MPKNVGDLGKFIVAKGFKKLPKFQKIAQSGHTARYKGEDSRVVTNRKLPTCGQSYKQFAIVIYDFTVVVLTRNLYRERF